MKFLVKEQGKSEEFPGLYFYLIYPKNEQNRCTNFSKKIFIFLEHNFLPLIKFLLHFYALIFFKVKKLEIFPKKYFSKAYKKLLRGIIFEKKFDRDFFSPNLATMAGFLWKKKWKSRFFSQNGPFFRWNHQGDWKKRSFRASVL